MAKVTLDFMEYPTNILAQAAYVTNAVEIVDQQNIVVDDYDLLGNISGIEYRKGQSFQIQVSKLISAVEVKEHNVVGSPSGNWTLRIETDASGVPSGTLANANASIVVPPPGAGNTVKGTFATPFTLNINTTYHLVIQCDNQTANNYWNIDNTQYTAGGYAYGTKQYSGDGVWYTGTLNGDLYFKIYTLSLQSYSEPTIKIQGSYSLKVVATTGALNKTLIRTVSPTINLAGVNLAKLDMRALRTGANIKIGIHDSGGIWTEITPNITQAGQYQTFAWDLSGVADADKDAIDSIKITIVNADDDNTFYIDNFFGIPIPTVTTQAATGIGSNGATGNGTITDLSGETATARGFKYGLSQMDTWNLHEAGSFAEAAFALILSGLTSQTLYYIRAYATSPAGTGYGSWIEFTTTSWPALNPSLFLVQLRDRKFNLFEVLNKFVISLGWEYSRIGGCGQCTLIMARDVDSMGAIFPDYDLQIWLEDETGVAQLVYRGYLDSFKPVLKLNDTATLIFQGYAGQLSRVRIDKTYTDTELSLIIKDIIQNFVAPETNIIYDASKIDATNFSVDTITFDEMADSALKTLVELAGIYEWGVDINRTFFFKQEDSEIKHYVRVKRNVDTFDQIEDYSAIINKLYIKGGRVAGVVFEETVNNTESQVAYGIRAAIISNSSIATSSVAQRYGAMYMADSGVIQRRATIKLAKNLKFFEKIIPLGKISVINPPIRLGKHYGDTNAIYGLFKYGGQESLAIEKISYTLTYDGTRANINAGTARPDIALQIKKLEYEIRQISINS